MNAAAARIAAMTAILYTERFLLSFSCQFPFILLHAMNRGNQNASPGIRQKSLALRLAQNAALEATLRKAGAPRTERSRSFFSR